MKKFIKIILIVLLLLNIAQLPVWALDHPIVTKVDARLTAAPTKTAAREDAKLTTVKTRADAMIAQRLTSLQNLLTRVNNDTRLTSDEKTNLTNDINTTISNLQALKTKIDADTDLTTAIADTKSIVTDYRIYLIYEPKTRLLLTVDNLTLVNQNLTSLSTSLGNLLNNLKSQGQDVSTAQTALDDMNAKIADATTQLTNAKSLLDSITVSQAGQQPFVTVKQDLAQVRQDYAAIRSDLAAIKNALKTTIKTAHASGTPIPHPTCILRPACLFAKFPCKIAEPSGGWCPSTSPTPTP